MPVDFLTDEREQRYGCFSDGPTLEQLDKCFQLDLEDRDVIARRAHGDHNRPKGGRHRGGRDGQARRATLPWRKPEGRVSPCVLGACG